MNETILDYSVYVGHVENCVNSVLANDLHNFEYSSKNAKWLACLNPHSYVVARDDIAFANALKHADWLLPDGIGVVLASKILGGCLGERITGFDFFAAMHNRMNSYGNFSVFFLGSSKETLAKIMDRMNHDYPNIKIVGGYSPPFGTRDFGEAIDDMVASINLARPDVLWVGLGAPKQEKWIYENLNRLEVGFIGAIGAVFDFYSGSVRRPNHIFHRFNFEWLYRLIQEPRRLWRRTFISAPVFLFCVVRAKFFRC